MEIYCTVLYFNDGRKPYLADVDLDDDNGLTARARITRKLHPEATLKIKKVDISQLLAET